LKFSQRAGSILAALALSIVGCDPDQPKPVAPPEPEEHSDSKQGPPSPTPPVMPSAKPILPDPGNPEMKPDEKKVEPKVEPPK
jgi:colicin import membrane protein